MFMIFNLKIWSLIENDEFQFEREGQNYEFYLLLAGGCKRLTDLSQYDTSLGKLEITN